MKYEASYVRFMEYEFLSLSLHFPPITRIDVHYRIRICCEMISAISDGRVIDYFNARVWSPAALIKICQHWRASCKLVSIASKTGIPPWGQPKMQSRMNMMIVVRRQHFLPDPLIHKTKNRVSFFAAPSPLPLLLPSSVFSTVFTYGFHSINLDSL